MNNKKSIIILTHFIISIIFFASNNIVAATSSKKVVNAIVMRTNKDHPRDSKPEYEWTFKTASVKVVRNSEQKVFIAGDKDGYRGFKVDDALYINNRGFFSSANPVDITSMIPVGAETTLNFRLVDVGVRYGCSDIFIVWKSKEKADDEYVDIAVMDISLDKYTHRIIAEYKNIGDKLINNRISTILEIKGYSSLSKDINVYLLPGRTFSYRWDNKPLKSPTEVKVILDPTKELIEKNRENNVMKRVLGRADLRLVRAYLDKNCFLQVIYHNIGDCLLSDFGLKIEDNSGSILKSFYVLNEKIRPNSTKGFNTNIKIIGSKELVVTIDPDNRIKEFNEKNNILKANVKCDETDIAITNISLDKNCNIKYTVKNVGNTKIRNNLRFVFYKNNIITIGKCQNWVDLDPGFSESFTNSKIKIENPSTIRVYVGKDQLKLESNKLNNSMTKNLNCTGYYDIAVSDIFLKKYNRIYVEYENLGTRLINKKLNVKILINNLTNLADKFEDSFQINFNLLPGQKIVIPWRNKTVSYTANVEVIVDLNNSLKERNEYNNTKTEKITFTTWENPKKNSKSKKVISAIVMRTNKNHPRDSKPEYEWTFKTASVKVVRNSEQKVFIAGDKDGYRGFKVDDALYINNRGFFSSANPVDITSMIPVGAETTLNFRLVDVGVRYGCSDIFIVWK